LIINNIFLDIEVWVFFLGLHIHEVYQGGDFPNLSKSVHFNSHIGQILKGENPRMRPVGTTAAGQLKN
jgi:hypothetical protein